MAAQTSPFRSGSLAASPSPILVVDDDQVLCELIATGLRHAGYTVRTASNGLDALLALEAVRPSLVILDMQMPILDGWEFAAEARAAGFDPPVLVITANTRNPSQAAREVDAADFLGKPFDLDDLLTKVEQLRAA
jgi:DNA-binding response OmpR family regulator